MGINNVEFSDLDEYSALELRKLFDDSAMVCTSLGSSYAVVSRQITSRQGLDQIALQAQTLGATYLRL